MSAATEVRSRGERLRDRSGDATSAGVAAPGGDLVLDRQLLLLEAAYQSLVGHRPPHEGVDGGLKSGVLLLQVREEGLLIAASPRTGRAT